MDDSSQRSKGDIKLLDFDDENKQLPNNTQKINISLSEKNQDRIENPSYYFRSKQMEQEKQQIKSQIDQMINHLQQMKTMCERKIQNCLQPSQALQRNMVYLKKYTFSHIQDFINQLNSFKSTQFPNNLFELYEFFELKMEQFYQKYNSIYFDIKMFIERSNFYLNEDNERDIKLISQIINN